MKNIRNLTLFIERTGKRIPVQVISDEVTAQEFLSTYEGKLNLPQGASTRGVLIRQITRKLLLPQETLKQAGVGDGETLIVEFSVTAGRFEFYPDGKVKNIETTLEETQYLADILREIRMLHETTSSLEKGVTEIKAEIKEIQNSTIMISGNNTLLKRHEIEIEDE